ncbi:MAG: hypothetical protein GC184_13650 [Rhizobiales bacterium]|nr:hypothetical protein [Hyphomicrobiales bacterium]
MTASDFDRTTGAPKPSFAERLGRAEPPPANGEAPEASAGTGPYRAFGFLPTGNVGETCEVTRWIEGTEIPEGIEFQYRFLMQVGYVGDEQLRLFLPDCIVVIEGRNLRELRKKLARRRATFVQQYSRKVWPEVPPNGETVVEKIEVVRPEPVRLYRRSD